MFNVECGAEVALLPFNIQHSTLNIEHSTFNISVSLRREPLQQRQQRTSRDYGSDGHRVEGFTAADLGAGDDDRGQLIPIERLSDDAVNAPRIEFGVAEEFGKQGHV